jgi:hypothetical protein
MIHFIANILTKLNRKRVILDRESNEPYMERYYIFLKERTWFPFNVFLHKFLKSDPDDHHDHPWSFFTIILKGGYWEWIPQINSEGKKYAETAVWRKAGSFRFASATSFHRIEIDPTVETWTLFSPFCQVREWGFFTKGKWVHHQEYIDQKNFRED